MGLALGLIGQVAWLSDPEDRAFELGLHDWIIPSRAQGGSFLGPVLRLAGLASTPLGVVHG